MMRILTLAWKDIQVRFSNRTEILFFLILPVAFTLILGGSLFGAGSEPEPGVPMVAVDEDGSQRSAELLSLLQESEAIRLELADRERAETKFEDESLAALLVIPAGFQANLMAGVPADLELQIIPNDLDSLAVQQAVQAAASTVGRALAVANASVAEAERRQPFASEAERLAYFEVSLAQAQQMLADAPNRLTVTRPRLEEAESGGGYDQSAQAGAGQLITWVFIPLLGTSELFAFERARGTLRRLLTTPTSSATYLLGTITGQLATSIVQMVVLVSIGVGVMKINWGHSPAGLAVMLLAFALAAVALGTTLGTFIKTESQANGLSIMLGMAMALLGGCWYPSELFPEVARTAAKALPTYWAMEGLTDLSMGGQGLTGILPEAGVLLGFAVVFFVIGVRRFRYE